MQCGNHERLRYAATFGKSTAHGTATTDGFKTGLGLGCTHSRAETRIDRPHTPGILPDSDGHDVSDTGCDENASADHNADINADNNTNPYAHPFSLRHTDVDADEDWHIVSDNDVDCDPNTHGYSYIVAFSNGHCDSKRYPFAFTFFNFFAFAHINVVSLAH
ncbi:MAG: hypothetical protein MHM6MM_006451 [Cercozoa sp. M6MM]